MAVVEVDEEQLVPYQRLMALYNKMSADPKAKKNLQRAIKEVAPDYQTEEDAAEALAAPYVEQLRETQKKLDELQKSLAEKDAKSKESTDDADLTQRLRRVQSQYNFTEEGMKRLTDTMITRKIANPEDAAKLIEFEKPKTPQGSSYESSRWMVDATETANGRPSFADWVNNTEATVQKEIAGAMNDVYAARERAAS